MANSTMTTKMTNRIYALADSLNMSVYEDNGTLRGKSERTISVAGVKLDFPMEIIGSLMGTTAFSVLVQGPGDVLFFAIARDPGEEPVVSLYVLDKGKLTSKPLKEIWAEAVKAGKVVETFKPVIVATYHKNTAHQWSLHKDAA